MRNLIVTLADIEGVPHGSATSRTSAVVSARYTWDLVTTDGAVIPAAMKPKPLPTGGAVTFSVHPSQDPDVAEGWRGFGVVVEATIRRTDGRGSDVRVSRTVVVPDGSGSVQLGSLAPADPLPPDLATVDDVIGAIDNLSATAETLPAGSDAAAVVTGPMGAKVINLSIPRGADGQPGMGYEQGQALLDQNADTLAAAQTAATDAADAIRANLATDISTPGSPAYDALVDVAGTLSDPQTAGLIGDLDSETRAALDTLLESVAVDDADVAGLVAATDSSTRAALDTLLESVAVDDADVAGLVAATDSSTRVALDAILEDFDPSVDLTDYPTKGEVADEYVSTEGVDASVSALVGDTTSDTLAALRSREQWVNPLDYGVVGDGITDDTAALQAAIDAAPVDGTVRLQAGTTISLSGITISGATLDAPGATLTKTGSSSGHWITLGDGGRIVGATINPAGLATSTVVLSESSTGAAVEGCIIESAEDATDAIRFTDTTRGRIVGNRVDGTANGIRVINAAVDLTCSDNTVVNWQTRGINASGTGGIRNAVFNGNRITDPNIVKLHGEPGHVGQPFSIQGDDANPHRNVYVTNNVVIGNGRAEEDPVLSGVAGCISMHRVHGGVVSGNIVTDGGEDGYTFARGCRNLTVTGNQAIRMDGPGYHLRAPGSTYTGNVALNCGLDRVGSKAAGNTYSLSGFRINGVNEPGMSDSTFVGNAAIDDQASPTMLYGVAIRDTQNMVFSANVFLGVEEKYIIDPASTTNADLVWTDENSSPSEDAHISLTVGSEWATGSEAEAWARGGYVILSLRFRPSSGTEPGATLASLPAGMRPPATIRASAVNTSGEGYDINVRANGSISPRWSGSPSNFANCSITIPL